ncbi:MAG: DUF86 domain-containing protein [Candidatus Magasanikbacteria bacterium]|nr:DUF86 domain-containing protein [Candidatus Magasanikbacteria bacterium]
MPILPLLREAVIPRLDGILKDIKKLRELHRRGPEEFVKKEDTFALAQHHLRLALEGVFHIGAHVLSRLEGGRAREYAELAVRLGELGVVPKEFAESKLVPMAKMRNLLTHFYAEVEAGRLYDVLAKDIDDIEIFLQAIKHLFEHPDRLGLAVE